MDWMRWEGFERTDMSVRVDQTLNAVGANGTALQRLVEGE